MDEIKKLEQLTGAGINEAKVSIVFVSVMVYVPPSNPGGSFTSLAMNHAFCNRWTNETMQSVYLRA